MTSGSVTVGVDSCADGELTLYGGEHGFVRHVEGLVSIQAHKRLVRNVDTPELTRLKKQQLKRPGNESSWSSSTYPYRDHSWHNACYRRWLDL